ERRSVKVPTFNGSARRDGNSQTLLAKAIRGEQGAEVRFYNLNDANIRPCQNSGSCYRDARNAR
ncbi:MAG TPA: hypothetical protein VLD55_09485, partial [Candidatus Sulfobium mesophilum]|nr:hypothetical protein [Candidatus Sulfobium mesophilum]